MTPDPVERWWNSINKSPVWDKVYAPYVKWADLTERQKIELRSVYELARKKGVNHAEAT